MRQHARGARGEVNSAARAVIGAVVLMGSALVVVPKSPAGAAPILPPSNPAVNVQPQVVPDCTYSPINDVSAACTDSILHNINYGRSLEGLGPMVLPGTYSTDSVAVQQLIITDKERGDRGLSEFSGLDPLLNAAAQVGATNEADPTPPGGYQFTSWGSNFALDYTALGADFAWMYDDGWGGTNLDCTSPSAQGCWGHRDNILGNWTTTANQTAEMGDGNSATPAPNSGRRVHELFVNEKNPPVGTLVDPLTPSTLPTTSTPTAPDVVQVSPASSPNTAAGTPVTIEGNYFGTAPRCSSEVRPPPTSTSTGTASWWRMPRPTRWGALPTRWWSR